MAVPKRSWSKKRTRTRNAHWKIEAKNLGTCDNCNSKLLPHRACGVCGFYRGKQVVAVKDAE